ncbi:MAG: sortase [Bacilli bacterium]|nr:sortase [Bacilli bacterium]
MGEDRLTNRQFVAISLVIIMCGIAIIGHDYFLAKRSKAYEEMSILLSQEPQAVEPVDGENDTSRVISGTGNNTSNNSNRANDPSGKVKKSTYTYNYIGRLKIPSINLNRGFVKYGTAGNTVNQNIAIMSGSKYPDENESNFIIAAHNGSGWNAYFTNIDKLKLGAMAYVTYKGKEYSYILKKIYSDPKRDGRVTLYKTNNKKHLTLVTCKRPDYKKYYLVLVFELVEERDM